MKLNDIDRLASFAWLGPGFCDGRCTLLSDLRPPSGDEAHLVFARFEDEGKQARRYAGRMQMVEPELDGMAGLTVHGLADDDDYAGKVARIREAIAAGDVYQVCYTLRVGLGQVSGADVLRCMCRGGVPRFAAWVRLPDGLEFVSASPELFFELDGRQVRSEPMKGTARRNAAGELACSDKDRAELAMITDLVRNDLTRVSRPGSVRVPCARRTIELPYAVQTVSDVTGELEAGVTVLDVLDALHPGGSVTGAPKLSALAWIRELETTERGPYCGTLGLVQGDRARFALLIRTAMAAPDGWYYGVGSGIVYDSEAALELDELRTKLGALG